METLTGPGLIRDDEVFLRMNLTERLQHILLIVSFTLLVLTVLPLMFYELRVFKSIFSLGKAFYVRGLLHRAAAVILIFDIVWHFAYTILTRRGRDNFKEMIPGIKDLLDAVTLFADHAAGILRREAATCLCHNDVHHLNVVEDDDLRLIDWEYAGVGEPLFDLASVCVYHRYGRTKRERLLAAYGAQTRSVSSERLDLACWLFDYIRDLWTAVRQGT